MAPAALLAACSLADDGGEATPTAPPATPAATSSEPDDPPATDATPATTPATTTADTETDPETATPAPTQPPSDDAPPVTTDAVSGGSTAGPISFASDVEPIIASTCASCHTGRGPGVAHVQMDTAGAVARASAGLALVTETGFMPPWPATDESIEFRHDWSLSDDEIELISQWHESGSPLDVPDDRPIEPTGLPVRLEDPDISVRAQGAYDGAAGQDDEYRCFIYDPELDGPGFVTGLDFLPEQSEVVHHAVGFRVAGRDRPALEALDGADGEGGGWTCFGFRPGASADLVYAWAPGQAATRYPHGTGLLLDDGDFFVVQTHYHFETDAPPDSSTLDIDWLPLTEADGVDPVGIHQYLGPAEIPCRSDETGPLCDRATAVARNIEKYGEAGFFADGILGLCGQTAADYAGFTDGVAESSCDQRVNVSGEIVSIFGHEHEIGTRFRMTLNPGTPDEVVLLDIDEWDFDWQLNYEPVDPIVLEPDDVLRMECAWDRALRDPDLEPAYVLWSDGTDDEMCFASIVTRPV